MRFFVLVLYVGSLTHPLAAFPHPHLSFSFRQHECILGIFQEDVSSFLTLTRDIHYTTCWFSQQYPNAINRVNISHTSSPNSFSPPPAAAAPLVSQALGSSFLPFTQNKMTVELWITIPRVESNGEVMLINIASGEENNVTSDFSISIVKRDVLQVQYSFVEGSAETGAIVNEYARARFLFENCTPFQRLLQSEAFEETIFLSVIVQSVESVVIYVGRKGSSLESCRKSTSLGERNTWRSFAIRDTSILQLGGGQGGFSSGFRFLGFYPLELNASALSTRFETQLPNSNPVPIHAQTWFAFQQSTMGIVNLSACEFFDAEGQGVKKWLVLTLPHQGTLFYNGVSMDIAPFLVSVPEWLQYRPFPLLDFSQADIHAPCRNEFTSFWLKASDGLCEDDVKNCFSPRHTQASICVWDVADPPRVMVLLDPRPKVHVVRLGSFLVFTVPHVDIVDGDDGRMDALGVPSFFRFHDSPGHFSVHSKLVFVNTTGQFGTIHRVREDGNSCDLESTSGIFPLVESRDDAFRFCYVTNRPYGSNDDIVGEETFWFAFEDAGSKSEAVPVSFRVLTPLEMKCETGFEEGCSSQGKETNPYGIHCIPVYLQGKDYMGDRDVYFEIIRLPGHGKLFRVTDNDDDDDTTCNVLVWKPLGVGDVIPQQNTSHAQVVYVGNTNYFNVNGSGVAVFCNASRDAQCVDSFEYILFVRFPAYQKSTGKNTHVIFVTAEFSGIQLMAPASVSVENGLRTPVRGVELVGVVDDDEKDEFQMELCISFSCADFGGLSIVGLPVRYYSNKDVIITECAHGLEFGVCPLLSMVSRPSKLNMALSALGLTYVDASKEEEKPVCWIHIDVFHTQSEVAFRRMANVSILVQPMHDDRGDAAKRVSMLHVFLPLSFALIFLCVLLGLCIRKRVNDDTKEKQSSRHSSLSVSV